MRPTLPTTPHSEAVRVAGTASDHTYSTIVGDIDFNEDGDTSQKIVSILPVDPAGANGKGDWKFETRSTTPSSRSAVQAARPGIDDPRPRNIQGPASTSSQAKDPR